MSCSKFIPPYQLVQTRIADKQPRSLRLRARHVAFLPQERSAASSYLK